MIDLELFHFLRPQWFIALLPLALLAWFLFFRKGAQSNWEAVVDERLLPHILIRGGRQNAPCGDNIDRNRRAAGHCCTGGPGLE